METDQIIELMKAVSENGLTDFSYEENGVALKMKKHPEAKIIASSAAMGRSYIPAFDEAPEDKKDEEGIDEANAVVSPLVGTFYCAPSPDADPYVRVGDAVRKGQVLGIVEAMKLMNEIETEKDGVVKSILVNNGDLVEYGQPLFVIE